jgi:hypothetical protein
MFMNPPVAPAARRADDNRDALPPEAAAPLQVQRFEPVVGSIEPKIGLNPSVQALKD